MKGIHPDTWKTASFARRILVTSLFGLASSLTFAAEYQLLDLGANVAPKDINSFSEIAGARNTDQYPNREALFTRDPRWRICGYLYIV